MQRSRPGPAVSLTPVGSSPSVRLYCVCVRNGEPLVSLPSRLTGVPLNPITEGIAVAVPWSGALSAPLADGEARRAHARPRLITMAPRHALPVAHGRTVTRDRCRDTSCRCAGARAAAASGY